MTTTSPLGDLPPAALTTYWRAIEDGRIGDAAACFSRDALYAAPRIGAGETAPRAVTTGAAALLDRFLAEGLEPGRHAVRICLADGRDSLVEGVMLDPVDEPVATYVCSVRTAPDGLIDRYLTFSCLGARDPLPADVDETVEPADAAAAVRDYLTDLDDGRFDAAAAHFSPDVLYSHPPYQHTGIEDPGRIEFRGRTALRAAFDRRGTAAFDHVTITSIQRGPHCILEGAVRGLPDGGTGSFISSLSLAADATIRRYVSFYCEPAVPQHA